MDALHQILVVTWIQIRTVPQRMGASLAAAFGVAGVVAVMVAMLSIAEGFRATLASTGSPATALVMRTGAESELSSSIGGDAVKIVADAPGIVRSASGPVTSAEVVVIVDLPMRKTGTEANASLRGVEPGAFDVREKVRIIEGGGRIFKPGTNEMIVGVGAREQFRGVDLGSTLRLGEAEWRVVGVFEAGGSLHESELWCDVRVLQPAYRRGNVFQSMYARLESPDRFDAFKDALSTDPRVQLKVVREDEYYAGQSQFLTSLIQGLGMLVAALMAVGAIFGAVNTMYSAVSTRTREIATLRALGFQSGPVVVSVLAESLLLALAGGVAGAFVAYFGFNGFRTATMNWQSFSQVVFAFKVTPTLMALGLTLSLLLGLLGGLLPALRAARLPVATALREL